MSESSGLTALALVLSFTALIIAVVQLLQSVFGTAEGFRRTNKEIMGIFALSRDRVFHWTEFRFETKFTTPHFTFHNVLSETSLLSRIEGNDPFRQETFSRFILAIANSDNRFNDLKALIRSSTKISGLQQFLNRFNPSYGSSHQQTLQPGSQAFSASWLILLEQLYYDEKKFNQSTDKCSFIYTRSGTRGISLGPDRRQILYPAIENHLHSWDLLPPDVVRPFASISLGDLLTLCFRLRLTVQDLRPGHFSADGYGNNFASLQIQGLGMIVQYRYDPSNDKADPVYLGNTKYVPSESTDKLAFGIIPRHELLGIQQDWPLGECENPESFPDAMKKHFRDIGIPEQQLREVKTRKDKDKCDTWRTFADSLLLIAPFLPIDGLGMVKYQPPMPEEWSGSTLTVREGRIILWQRLNEILPGLKESSSSLTMMSSLTESSAPSQLHWVCRVLNFFETKYRNSFHNENRCFGSFMGRNGYNARAHEFLRDIRSAAVEADSYLASLFNQPNSIPTYIHLVAAHQQMAITLHTEVNQQLRETENQDRRSGSSRTPPKFRVASHSPARELHKGLLEIVHRYVDCAIDGRTIIEAYRAKIKGLEDSQGRQPPALDDEQIRAGWYTMMLRACLWSMVHLPISRPNLPYPSRYWKNNTLVLMA
ncbi:uncharacterized protein Z518_01888 [Rhinocladiella mackenziei CBS 650.93]|uniref:Uncharacterized protein n=1 Tax=Rhinocladiella mackenziei CBS 650.93 TaxID=1442369 RepID=A0A0D2JDI0_9EURO|nr:uncharacterized protein Z518_01888 [Rhinocladiella mackenziei CBS 650.93]KIX07235.1 hypothetical protein Z518_01888 [Rhinocladiella mackenziei CBS 650.93]